MADFKNPKVAVDGVIFEGDDVLLIRRRRPPFRGRWALPGGFVEYGEMVENAVVREVLEETGLKAKVLKLVGVYSDPSRDPRGHTIGIVFLCKRTGGKLKGGDDAAEAKYFKARRLPRLAFDHKKLIQDAIILSKRK